MLAWPSPAQPEAVGCLQPLTLREGGRIADEDGRVCARACVCVCVSVKNQDPLKREHGLIKVDGRRKIKSGQGL